MRGAGEMVIYGVALLAGCTLLGALLGDALGAALGINANVGGVGIAMVLLIAARLWLQRRGLLAEGVRFGITFWGALYIPIVVAMAATQNVAGAVKAGPMVVAVAAGAVAICFAVVRLMGRFGGPVETMDEMEARLRSEAPAPGDDA